MSSPYSVEHYQRPMLEPPDGHQRILLHSCCAPCACEIIDSIKESGLQQTVYFYNPNIHPREEYELRKSENKRYCEKNHIEFVDGDYDTDNWFKRVAGLENEPEKGHRCTLCFSMRFERTALYAHEHGFPLISSTLGISRWKNMAQVTHCGVKAAERYPDLSYWTINWRKKGGALRMVEISKEEAFYQQEYCGCVYSLRDTNHWRMSQGRPRIRRLVKFYSQEQDEPERFSDQ